MEHKNKTHHNTDEINKYFLLYIKKESMGLLRSIVSEYFSLDMMRKLEDS